MILQLYRSRMQSVRFKQLRRLPFARSQRPALRSAINRVILPA